MQLVLLHALPLDGRMWDAVRTTFSDAFAPTLYELGDSVQEWADAIVEECRDELVVVGNSSVARARSRSHVPPRIAYAWSSWSVRKWMFVVIVACVTRLSACCIETASRQPGTRTGSRCSDPTPRAAAASLTSARGQQLVFDRCGHYVPLEQPEKLIRVIKEQLPSP